MGVWEYGSVGDRAARVRSLPYSRTPILPYTKRGGATARRPMRSSPSPVRKPISKSVVTTASAPEAAPRPPWRKLLGAPARLFGLPAIAHAQTIDTRPASEFTTAQKCIIANEVCFMMRAGVTGQSPEQRIDRVNEQLAYILGYE